MQLQALDLRRVDNVRWQVMTAVGQGRVLDFPGLDMQLEVFHPPWSTQGRRLGPRATFDTAVRSRLGDILTDGAGSLWCLLGGVPMVSPEASQAEREVRQSIALTRTPPALTAVLGPLAPLPLPAPADLRGESSDIDESDVNDVIGADAVEMMLRLTREDVTVYSRAWAAPYLWLSLLGGMADTAPREPASDEQIPVLDESRMISSAVSFAAGALAVNVVRALAVGDVVRLPTTFRPDGTGSLRIADVDLGVRWRSRSPDHVFEVTNVSVSPWAVVGAAPLPGNSKVPLEQVMMNVEGQGDLASPYAGDAMDDAPSGELPAPSASTSIAATDGAPVSAVDRVPVSVVAEIGTLTMSLGDLRRLRVGTLIKLGGRGEDEVVLRAVGGPALAYGELVDIGGHVGLQISRLADA